MAYVQKNNPIPRTGCGRRRMEQMVNPFKMNTGDSTKVNTTKKKNLGQNLYLSKKDIKRDKEYNKNNRDFSNKNKYKPQSKDEKDALKNLQRLNYKPSKNPLKKISGPCKSAAKRKFKVWPSAYASGWGVRCTKAGGPSKFGG
tara:strand:+ start:991 stop:1419 length:429 start_codon:yes stop_codon:yes gene_type:complete